MAGFFDTYTNQVARARAQNYQIPGARPLTMGGNQTRPDWQGDSFSQQVAEKYASNYLQPKVDKMLNFGGAKAASSFASPTWTSGGGGVGSQGTYWAGNAADAGSSLAGTAGGEGASGGMGGMGNAMLVLAILEGALKARGRNRNKETGEEIPWHEKDEMEKVNAAPFTAGSPMYLATLLTGGYEDDNPHSKWANNMAKAEYDAMKPLYNLFVAGPEMDQSDNPFFNWGD